MPCGCTPQRHHVGQLPEGVPERLLALLDENGVVRTRFQAAAPDAESMEVDQEPNEKVGADGLLREYGKAGRWTEARRLYRALRTLSRRSSRPARAA